jgi:hypothetical protein
MKLTAMALVLAATTCGALAANAQTTTIIQDQPPAVVVDPAPSATVTTKTHEHSGFLGTTSKTTTETTGTGPSGDCATKTVHKEGLAGDKTVSRTDCP